MDTCIIVTISQPVSDCSVVGRAVVVDVYMVLSSGEPEDVGKTATKV